MKRTWTEKGLLVFCAAVLVVVIWRPNVRFNASAQESKSAPTARAPKIAEIPASMGIRIRNVQLAKATIDNQVLDMEMKWQQLQQQAQHDAKELEDLKAEALREAKLDPKDWDVDVQNLKFAARAKK